MNYTLSDEFFYCLVCDKPSSEHTIEELKRCRDKALDSSKAFLETYQRLDHLWIKKRQQFFKNKE